MKYVIIVFVIILVMIGSFSFIFQLNIIASILVFLLIVLLYLSLLIIYRKQVITNLIDDNLKVARTYLLDNDQLMFIIHKNGKVVWANDHVYDEFSILLKNKQLDAINLNLKYDVNRFEYHNNNFEFEKLNDNLLLVRNVTSEYRQIKTLRENQANIGYLEIDNYEYMENNISNSEFIKIMSFVKTELFEYFNSLSIFYEENDQSSYTLIYPLKSLEIEKKSNFKNLYNIIDKFREHEYDVSISIGIGLNNTTIIENGKAAKDALRLATTRGGGQIVIFDGDSRKYYGSASKSLKGSIRLKARLMNTSIFNLLSNRDYVYLFAHQRPDSDAISALLLMNELITNLKPELNVRIMIDPNLDLDLKNKLEEFSQVNYYYDIVVDKTKNNLAIICDTQSTEFVANKDTLFEIDDKIIIDHHQTPLKYFENAIFSWVESNASSTTELVTEMLIANDIKLSNKKVANFGLLGIMTDSSNLKYRIDSYTLDVMSYLVRNGGSLNYAISEQYLTPKIFKLKQRILQNLIYTDKYAIIRTDLTQDDFILSIAVNESIEVKGIDLGIIISKSDSNYKVKIRSSGNVNAKAIIEEFGGAGHMQQAAGIIKEADVEQLIKKLDNLEV